MTEPVLVEIANAVATITLNRPDAMNSLDTTAKVALRDAVLTVATDDGVRCVVVTGTGRAFCVGQDLREHAAMLEDDSGDIATTVREHYAPICAALATMGKPVVAAVNGVAAGAGANLALACDIVLAAKSASFIEAFCKLGLIPDTGGTWVLPRLLGPARAMGLAMLGDKLPAEKAEEWGLIWKCVDDEALDSEVDAIAQKLASLPPLGLTAIKKMIRESWSHTLDQELNHQRDAMRRLGFSEDYREGVSAFLEKRQANFVGR